jgi:hypothetical protein
MERKFALEWPTSMAEFRALKELSEDATASMQSKDGAFEEDNVLGASLLGPQSLEGTTDSTRGPPASSA